MSLSDCRNALAQAFVDAAIFDPATEVQWENKQFEPPNGKWAAFYFFGGQPVPVTLGEGGLNEVYSFLQIDLNFPPDSGEKELNTAYDTLESVFTVGTSFASSGGQLTKILSCGRANGRKVNSHYRVPVTINFYAQINR